MGMGVIQSVIRFLGRICLSLIFIASGVYTLLNWQSSEQALVGALCDWLSLALGVEWAQKLCELGLSWSFFLLAASVICEIVGGLLVFLGLGVRLGALLLLLFMIPATVLFQHFWTFQGPERELQMVMFLKNLSIIGGLLGLLAYDKGAKRSKVSKGAPEA